jgi:hypothetical protein
MAKKELKEQLKSYEGYINDIPLVIDPCKMCKNHTEEKGYAEPCSSCSWFYPSNFEIGVSDNSCRTCKHYNKITSGKEPCHSCDNGNRWEE